MKIINCYLNFSLFYLKKNKLLKFGEKKLLKNNNIVKLI